MPHSQVNETRPWGWWPGQQEEQHRLGVGGTSQHGRVCYITSIDVVDILPIVSLFDIPLEAQLVICV